MLVADQGPAGAIYLLIESSKSLHRTMERWYVPHKAGYIKDLLSNCSAFWGIQSYRARDSIRPLLVRSESWTRLIYFSLADWAYKLRVVVIKRTRQETSIIV